MVSSIDINEKRQDDCMDDETGAKGDCMYIVLVKTTWTCPMIRPCPYIGTTTSWQEQNKTQTALSFSSRTYPLLCGPRRKIVEEKYFPHYFNHDSSISNNISIWIPPIE